MTEENDDGTLGMEPEDQEQVYNDTLELMKEQGWDRDHLERVASFLFMCMGNVRYMMGQIGCHPVEDYCSDVMSWATTGQTFDELEEQVKRDHPDVYEEVQHEQRRRSRSHLSVVMPESA